MLCVEKKRSRLFIAQNGGFYRFARHVLEHMEEVTSPPIKADEIDPALHKCKHQLTIHNMKKCKKKESELEQT